MDNLKITIANNIAKLRKLNNLTQQELATKLNYSDKAISKWERGESIPDITVLKTIADLFSVKVDYLLYDNHNEELPAKKEKYTPRQRFNHKIITAISSMLVWLIATLVFVNIDLIVDNIKYHWLVFIYAVPITTIVVLVFNCIWGNRKWNFLIITVLVWTILLAIYLSAIKYNLWLIFVIGIPAQIIIILWSRLKFK